MWLGRERGRKFIGVWSVISVTISMPSGFSIGGQVLYLGCVSSAVCSQSHIESCRDNHWL